MVVVLILIGSPPDGVLGVLVHDDELILGRTAGIDAGENVDSAQIADIALLIACQFRLCLLFEQLLVGGVVDDFRGSGNAILS